MTFTGDDPPSYSDPFHEVRRLIKAWNANMAGVFQPPWLSLQRLSQRMGYLERKRQQMITSRGRQNGSKSNRWRSISLLPHHHLRNISLVKLGPVKLSKNTNNMSAAPRVARYNIYQDILYLQFWCLDLLRVLCTACLMEY